MINDILVFVSSIDDFKESNLISQERLEKANKFKSIDDKKRCLLAETLLRKALQKCGLQLKNEPLSFNYNEYQKPYLKDYPDVYFNISHSGSFVVCAISDYEIGLDIEKIGNPNLKIAKRFFTNQEYNNIKDKESFYTYWVLKESYIKYMGKGLNIPLNSFDVSTNLNVFFKEIKDIKGYKCAVCSQYNLPIKLFLEY